MIQIKKTILTLVALIAAVTGAWAEEKMVTINYSTMSSGAVTATGFNILENFLYVSKNPATITTSEGVITKLVIKKYYGPFGDAFTEANVGVTPGTITYGSDEITVTDINAESVTLSRKGNANWSTSSVDVYYGAPTTFPFPITWDVTNKTTGFNLPAGNVTMNVEYYPVAELTAAPAAKSDIQAATAEAIVTAGTVAKIGSTENAQGTLMYYAVQSETAPDAPDYDNQNWSADVPTAADFNQGNVYVWYYVKGNDGDAESTFNDGTITKLSESGYVTLAAPPIYAITLAEGTEEAKNWIVPAEAEEGATVTVTYEGTRKVKSVKAVKKVKLATVSTAPTAKTGIKTGEDKAIINAGTAEGGTMCYAVTTTNTKPANIDGFSATVPTAKTLSPGTCYVWYYAKADKKHIDSEISATAIEVTIAKATPTFSVSPSNVSFASTDNVNATKQVTITYNGDGVLSVSSSNANMVTASVNNKTITLTRKSVDGGTVTITVSAAAGTNYSAASDKTITVNMTAFITGKALKDASVGWKYGSDGKAYPANASLPTGVTVLGMVAYKSGSGGIVMRSTYHGEELSNWRADMAGSDPFGSTNAYTSSLSNTTSYEWRTGTQAEYKNCGLTSVSGFDTLNTRLQTAGCNKLENNRYLGAKDYKRFYPDGEWENWNSSGTCLIRPIFVF